LPLSHRFIFTFGYCPDCIAHFDERMAVSRQATVWESLREAVFRLIGYQRVGLRKRSRTVIAIEDVS